MRRALPPDAAAMETLHHAAYAPNRAALGVEPLPLQESCEWLIAQKECWLDEDCDGPVLSLVLEPEADALLIWSLAVAPRAQGRGLARVGLAFAQKRAGALGCGRLRLYTGEKLTRNIAIYAANGFVRTRVETLADRRVVHMEKIVVGFPTPRLCDPSL